jgi:aspartyl-tRNA(Asn)/glutamyl-tRNA(Gln) amidotransferase subunit B
MANYYEAAASELAEREAPVRHSEPDEESHGQNSSAKAKTLLFNYLSSDLTGLMALTKTSFDAELKITPEHLAHLIDLIADGKIASRQAKDILAKMFADGRDPETIMNDEGLTTVSDAGELEAAVRGVIAQNPKAVEDYKKGKEASVQFLVGMAMRNLRGRGEPNTLRELIIRILAT